MFKKNYDQKQVEKKKKMIKELEDESRKTKD